MNVADVERLVERMLVKDLKDKFSKAFNRRERRAQRSKRYCLMGNTVAPGVEWKPVMHDPYLKNW
jgi:hypothetical protein